VIRGDAGHYEYVLAVLNLERTWLAAIPWQKVVDMNRELCLKDEQPHEPNAKGFEAAMQLWNQAAGVKMSLRETLGIFRQVHKLAPFRFFNGNTVAAVARTMMSEVVDRLPSIQAQMARSTVAHYVVGAVKIGELDEVLHHVGELWRDLPPAPPPQAASPAPPPTA
jgi:hypothetical protein